MIEERQYLKDALYDWITAIMADHERTDEVIWDEGKGVRPKAPFIELQFGTSERPGLPSYSRVDPENGEQHIYHDVEKTVTVHGFGEGSFDLLQTILDSIYVTQYKSFLKTKHLVVNKLTDVTEVGNVVDTEMEKRAKFDISVSFIRVTVDRPGWIDHVGIIPEDLPLQPINF
jgi:hypothetical protein